MSSQKPAAYREHRFLPAWLFYGVILSGLVAGLVASCLGGWLYLDNEHKPSGRGVWDEAAANFVIPICAIIGATFGGLGGVAAAIGITTYLKKRSSIGA